MSMMSLEEAEAGGLDERFRKATEDRRSGWRASKAKSHGMQAEADRLADGRLGKNWCPAT